MQTSAGSPGAVGPGMPAGHPAEAPSSLSGAVSLAASLLVAGAGVAVLFGWTIDSTALKSISPSFSQMKANTALCFVLAGAALALLLGAGERRVILGKSLAALTALIGLLTLAEHAFGWDLGIDQILFDDSEAAPGTPAPGRMGANSAFCFLLAGLSLLTLDREWRGLRPAQAGALAIGVVSLAAAIGYAYEVSNLETSFVTRNVTPMALHTALAFLTLSTGLLLARPGVGLMALVGSTGPGGLLVRRLLLPVLLVPPLLGYAGLRGEDAGLFGTEEGLALYATSLVVLLVTLVWMTARSLERADVARHESETRQRAILETALDPIVTVDREGRILDFNPAAKEAFGYRRRDVVGRSMAELIVPPALRARHLDAFARHLATGESTILGKRIEMTAMRSDGSEFPVELAISRADLSGEPFFTGYLRDTSERRRAEEEQANLEDQLRQAQKMDAIGRLAGGIAHDFNNLLTVIGGNSELQLRELEEGHPAREDAEEIKAATERAASLTKQLLAFSRRQVLEPRLLDLNDLLGEVEPMLRRLIGENVELAFQTEPGLYRVKADPNQIHQVILNLAINARDAMPKGGRLTLETSNVDLDSAYVESHASIDLDPGEYAMLSVSDTGVGIDAEAQDKVFDPFFTTKGPTEGTGLGLSTVYGIVRQSGGAIWVYSEPDHGATFKVYLPRAAVTEDERPPEPADPPDVTEATETVLVVEDEQSVRTLVRRILMAGGYTVLEAAEGNEAIELCGEHGGDLHLVITDMVMPGISGLDLSAELLRRRPGLKVLVMSGYSEMAIDDHSLGEQVDFIQKPFSSALLARRVRELLDARG